MVMDTDMGTATATDAPLLLIRRDRLATTVDTTPDMVVTATDIITTKSDFLLPLMTFPMVRLSKFCGISFLLSEIQRKLQLLKSPLCFFFILVFVHYHMLYSMWHLYLAMKNFVVLKPLIVIQGWVLN